MNIYSIVSDSHIGLMNRFFLPSLKAVEPESNIIIKHTEQVCNGLFYSDGWHRAMEFKIDQYIKACEETWGSYFIWADIDIEFYQQFSNYCLNTLNEYDIAFQESANGDVCAGFFLAKSNDNTMRFFKKIKEDYKNHQCDQNAINFYKSTINYNRFPNKTIWSPLKFWDGNNTNITSEAKLAHANYTVGVQNKTLLLLRAKKDYLQQQYVSNNQIKILSALYGKCVVGSNKSDIPNLIKQRPSDQNYLYLFDENLQIIEVLSTDDTEE